MTDPRTRLILLLCVGVLAVLVDRPLSLALLVAASATPLLLPVGWIWRRRALIAAAAVIWSTAVGQGLFYADLPRTPWLTWGPLTVWREGLLHGLVQSLRLVATTCAGLAVAVSTPPDRLFAALVALRVPYALALLAVTALRFVPVVGREVWTVREARARRGRPVWARAPWAWLRLEMALLVPVAARSLRRARALAEALDTRGFDPGSARRPRTPLRMGWLDLTVLLPALGLVGSVVVIEALYQAYLAELLYVPALRGLYGFARAWL